MNKNMCVCVGGGAKSNFMSTYVNFPHFQFTSKFLLCLYPINSILVALMY